MHIHYDTAADALAVQLTPGGRDVVTQEVAPGIFLDFDAQDRLTAIEVLHASRHVPRVVLEQYPYPVRQLTLAEASTMSGLSPVTLRRQISAGRIAAVKRGRDWLVEEVSLINYLESRAASGRPPAQAKARLARRTHRTTPAKAAAARTSGVKRGRPRKHAA